MSRATSTVVLIAVFSALVLVSCLKEKGLQLGKSVPDNVPVVKLSEIIESPEHYNGKTVVVKGKISGQCPSLCEFFLQDGVDKATIFPQGFKFPKLPVGNQVTVFAEITAGSENVVFSALGIHTTQEKK